MRKIIFIMAMLTVVISAAQGEIVIGGMGSIDGGSNTVPLGESYHKISTENCPVTYIDITGNFSTDNEITFGCQPFKEVRNVYPQEETKDTLTTITKTTIEPDYKYKIAEQYAVKMMQVIQDRMISEKLQNDSIPFAAETKRFISDVQKALVKYQSVFVVNKEINVSKKKINKEIAKIEKWKAKVDADPELAGAQNTKVYTRKMKRLAELKEMKKAAKKSKKTKIIDRELNDEKIRK